MDTSLPESIEGMLGFVDGICTSSVNVTRRGLVFVEAAATGRLEKERTRGLGDRENVRFREGAHIRHDIFELGRVIFPHVGAAHQIVWVSHAVRFERSRWTSGWSVRVLLWRG